MVNRNNDYELRTVEIPCDDEFYQRPFFAYGIFKKDQLAHSKITDCIENIVPDEIPRTLHIRDGVPVIENVETEKVTKGEKIRFSEKRICAYHRISNTQPGNIYHWDTIEIDGETFNILVTDDLEGTFENAKDNGDYLDRYDGHDDPFFFKVPAFIRNEMENMGYREESDIFKLQMYYMLLWSAIERYTKLKYDVSNKENDYLKALANDEVYQEAFRRVNPRNRDSISSAKNASRYHFDKTKPNFVVNFYYTIRCNVAHRGKEVRNNFGSLTGSLHDLLDIYENMIKITFNEDE